MAFDFPSYQDVLELKDISTTTPQEDETFTTEGGHVVGGGGFTGSEGGQEPIQTEPEGDEPDGPDSIPPGWIVQPDGNYLSTDGDIYTWDGGWIRVGPSEQKLATLLAEFESFLDTAGLPPSLIDDIEQWIREGRSPAEIDLLIRETDEYKLAFPEMALRRDAGFAPLTEKQILDLRDTFKEIGRTFGINFSITDIQTAIGNDISPAEIEHRADVFSRIENYGESAKKILEGFIGQDLDDDSLFEFFDQSIPTADLDKAYEKARILGDQGFVKLQAIEANIAANPFAAALEAALRSPDGTPLGDELKNISMDELIRTAQQLFAREAARFSQGGGPAQSQTGALVGLLTPDQR